MAPDRKANQHSRRPSPSSGPQPASSENSVTSRLHQFLSPPPGHSTFDHFSSSPLLRRSALETFGTNTAQPTVAHQYPEYFTYPAPPVFNPYPGRQNFHPAPYGVSSPPRLSPHGQNSSFETQRPPALLRAEHPDFSEDDWQAVTNLYSFARQGAVSPVIDVETCSVDEPIASTDAASPTAPICGGTTERKVSSTNSTSLKTGTDPNMAPGSATQWICDHQDKVTKSICKKKFGDYQRFKTHLARHKSKDDRRYMCNFCGQSLVQRSVLNTHLRIHTGDKPFKCEHCDRCFGDSSTHKKHVRIHTGEKPYPCRVELCAKMFSQSGNRIRHELTIHGYVHS